MTGEEEVLHASVERANRAKALLGDPLMVDAFDILERSYIAAWKSTPPRDSAGRELYWQAVQIVGKVRSHLESVAASAALEQKQLEELAGKKTLAQKLGIV